MNFRKLLENTIRNIVKNRGQAKAVQLFQKYIDENGWPIAYAKSTANKALRLLINEELPDSPVQAVLDIMLSTTRKPVKLTESQVKHLKLIEEIVNKAKRCKCKHKDLGLAPFLHGGGFFPMTTIPELICKNCGLNVTLRPHIEIAYYRKHFGIIISKHFLEAIGYWAHYCKNVQSSRDIVRDPIGAYNKSQKWIGPIHIEIENSTKLESKSGV